MGVLLLNLLYLMLQIMRMGELVDTTLLMMFASENRAVYEDSMGEVAAT
jgi:hypothetical protein